MGIVGGWYCDTCDHAIASWERPYEPLEDDVPIMSASEFLGDRPRGTPLSALSGQPGDPKDPNDPRHAGYERFKRIAKSYGYD